MSTPAPKKTAGRAVNNEAASPASSPARNSHRSTPSVSGAGGLGRSRSIRSSTPVSGRVAAGRKESSLSTSSDVDQDARAELVAQLDDLKERLSKAETSSEQHRKHAEVLQSRLDEAREESARLEEKVHENEERMEVLANEKTAAARQIREMETIYEAERSSMTKEKEEMSNREEEMQMVIQRLKDSLAQRSSNEDGRPSRQPHSPSVEGGFAPPASLHRSDSRNNSKLLLQKDKLIESLRLELAEAQIKLVESENSGGGRLNEVEKLLMEARMANARLMEDNESYQLLLQEKTLNGEFAKSDFGYVGGNSSSNQEALNALEGRQGGGTSLADELSDAASNEGESIRRLEVELKAAKDQNKALTLYINKIIERLLQHQDFEHILDQSGDGKPSAANVNKDLPPPPSDKAAAGPSFLQRAKSIAVGTGKPRPRPTSFMPMASQTSSAHEDPETAPRIPINNLTRTNSTRKASRPMSEQFTGAASLVNQMYRGPEGPTSPTLGNPRHSQTFIAARYPSGGASGNFPGMRSETSSTSGDSASVVGGSGEVSTPPSQASPPRSHHEKQTTIAGNKPRPLRLVQEAEATSTSASSSSATNKRASWMGWASAWTQKKDAAMDQPPQPPTPTPQGDKDAIPE